jgi:hypothetical protein
MKNDVFLTAQTIKKTEHCSVVQKIISRDSAEETIVTVLQTQFDEQMNVTLLQSQFRNPFHDSSHIHPQIPIHFSLSGK